MIKSDRLIEWLNNEDILKELDKYHDNYIDHDVCFDANHDVDFDTQLKGVTFTKFGVNYLKWVNFCKQAVLADKLEIQKDLKPNLKSSDKDKFLDIALRDDSSNSLLLRFSYALSLLCRRALNNACVGSVRANEYDFIVNGGSNIAGANSVTSNSSINTKRLGGIN